MPGMTMPAAKPAPTDTTRRAKPAPMGSMAMPADTARAHHDIVGMSGMNMGGMGMMSHAYSRNLPMSRNGSGTAWQPDQTDRYMWMQHKGPWMLMYHGAAFGRYTSQNFNHDGARGQRSTADGPTGL